MCTRHLRLTPLIAEEHRLPPLIIEYTDRSRSPPSVAWEVTREIVFENAETADLSPDSDIRLAFDPVWIPPSARELLWTGALVTLCTLAAGATVLAGTRAVRNRRSRPPPAGRLALEELEGLGRSPLVGQGRMKECCTELSGILRRYIEARYRIKAGKQTTRELLSAAAHDPRFPAAALDRFGALFETGDRVAFARRASDAIDMRDCLRAAGDCIRLCEETPLPGEDAADD